MSKLALTLALTIALALIVSALIGYLVMLALGVAHGQTPSVPAFGFLTSWMLAFIATLVVSSETLVSA